MPSSVSILFAGGASGGHLFPGIAVAEVLEGLAGRIGFVGSGTDLEDPQAPVRPNIHCVSCILGISDRRLSFAICS